MEIKDLLEQQENELKELNGKYAKMVTSKKELVNEKIAQERKEFNDRIKELKKSENEKYTSELKNTKKDIYRLNKSISKLKQALEIMERAD